MKAIRKYVRKKLKDTFEEETSSSEKKNDVETDGSLWKAAFQGSGQRTHHDPSKVQGSMWNLKYGSKETGEKPTAKKPEAKPTPNPEQNIEPEPSGK